MTAGTRGDVKSEDILKIRNVGPHTVLLAGDMSQARQLLAACTPTIKEFPLRGDDIAITKLQQGLTAAVRERKRAIATGVLSAELGVTYDEVFNWSQAHPDDPVWRDSWRRIRGLDLGAELIIATFTDDETAIMVVEAAGRVVWVDHYAAIGTGSPIAAAFLHQRDYLDTMPTEECVYRVLEAKTAAEKNPHVGKATALELRIPDSALEIDFEFKRRLLDIIEERRKVPYLGFDPKHIRPFGDLS